MDKQYKRAFLGIAKFLKKAAGTLAGAAVIVAALHGGIVEMVEVLALALFTRVMAAVIEVACS